MVQSASLPWMGLAVARRSRHKAPALRDKKAMRVMPEWLAGMG